MFGGCYSCIYWVFVSRYESECECVCVKMFLRGCVFGRIILLRRGVGVMFSVVWVFLGGFGGNERRLVDI